MIGNDRAFVATIDQLMSEDTPPFYVVLRIVCKHRAVLKVVRQAEILCQEKIDQLPDFFDLSSLTMMVLSIRSLRQ